jgi:hypothetical protein
MAAVLAVGFSTDNGDLPATAVSNVNGPEDQASGLPKWRTIIMKIRGFIAGLGIAGKLALGVSVAAAAAAGAGAAGVIPVPNHGHAHHHVTAPAVPTSTTTTTVPKHKVADGGTDRFAHHGAPAVYPIAPVVTTTTSPPATSTDTTPPPVDTTPTTAYEPPVTTPPTEATTTTVSTPTTEPTQTQSIQLSCSITGPTQVTCTWTAAPDTVTKYALWRWTTGGNGSDYAPVYQSPDGLTFVDNTVAAGTSYTYRVFTTRPDGTAGDFSNRSYISCCG